MKAEDKNELLEFLSKYKLMSLGTYSDLPWAATVYYLFDDDFNLYFLSSPDTLHCKNIEKNPKVSITVADSQQKASDKKFGFQARGEAQKVTSVDEINNIITDWNKRHSDAPPIDYETLMNSWKSKFYKIKLSDVKIFDQSQGDENEERIWKL